MPSVPGHSASAGVVIPLRAFTTGKARLAEVLDDRARSALATAMATTVVTAAGDLPIVIVSSAPEVQEWADTARLTVIEDPGSGLDHAVDVGRAHFRRLEVAREIVAHADLPRARPESLVRKTPRKKRTRAVAGIRNDIHSRPYYGQDRVTENGAR